MGEKVYKTYGKCKCIGLASFNIKSINAHLIYKIGDYQTRSLVLFDEQIDFVNAHRGEGESFSLALFRMISPYLEVIDENFRFQSFCNLARNAINFQRVRELKKKKDLREYKENGKHFISLPDLGEVEIIKRLD